MRSAGHEPSHFVGRGSDRLVHDHVPACFQDLVRVPNVPVVGGCDDDQLQRRVGKHGFQRSIGSNGGIEGLGVAGAALDHRGQFKAFDRRDQGRVKDLARHSETDQPNTNHGFPLRRIFPV